MFSKRSGGTEHSVETRGNDCTNTPIDFAEKTHIPRKSTNLLP